MPSRLSLLLQGTAVSTFAGLMTFVVWTKHSHFEPMDPSSDPTFRGLFFRRYNPNWNPTFHDDLVRRIPLSKLEPELRQDAQEGGSKLVTRFTQGVWGGFGYAIQRNVLAYKYKNDTTTKHQLWAKKELLNNDYAEGTEITDHFNVLSRPDNSTVLLRCGGSPLDHPNEPREGDGLFELSARADFEKGYAEFRMKSIFFQGVPKTDKAPFDGEYFMPWAHRQYTALLMENAVGHCKQKLTGDIDWDAVTGRSLFKKEKNGGKGEADSLKDLPKS